MTRSKSDQIRGGKVAGPAPIVDVALLLEGTYPFVPGGVSSWVHGLVTGMPRLSFGLIFLGGSYERREFRYQLPGNVVFLSEWAVYDFLPHRFAPRKPAGPEDRRAAFQAVEQLCLDLHEGHMASCDAVFGHLRNRTLSVPDLAYGPEAWKLLHSVYEKVAREISFLDFFWTWRYAYLPILNLFFAELPPARVYHTICTGWAGLLGVLARKTHGVPLILTEHGIYVNERRIEIASAEWVYSRDEDEMAVRRELGYFKTLWNNLFRATSQVCYANCEAIYTLFGGNKDMQVGFGAPEDRITVIRNGVDIDGLTPEELPDRGTRAPDRPVRIGFVGRIVPIKDVKTLIRACRKVASELPNVEVLLMGPTEEDPDYFAECQQLVEMLDFEGRLRFLGRVNVREYYPTLDVQVLTSVSEGQPLVILEGYCSGVPVVATRVGACQEMIQGMGVDDQSLGPSGIVTGIGNPDETAGAILEIVTDPERHRQMSEAAVSRVRKFYDYGEMISRYQEIYESYREGAARADPASGRPG